MLRARVLPVEVEPLSPAPPVLHPSPGILEVELDIVLLWPPSSFLLPLIELEDAGVLAKFTDHAQAQCQCAREKALLGEVTIGHEVSDSLLLEQGRMFAQEVEVEQRLGPVVLGINPRVLASQGVGGVFAGVEDAQVDRLASSLTAPDLAVVERADVVGVFACLADEGGVDAGEQLVFKDACVLQSSDVEGLPVEGLVEPTADALLTDAKARQVCCGGLADERAECRHQNLEKALSVLFNSWHLVNNGGDVSHEKPLCFE